MYSSRDQCSLNKSIPKELFLYKLFFFSSGNYIIRLKESLTFAKFKELRKDFLFHTLE